MEVANSTIMLILIHIVSNTYQVSIKRRMEFPTFISCQPILESLFDEVSYNPKRFFVFAFHIKFENLCRKLKKCPSLIINGFVNKYRINAR